MTLQLYVNIDDHFLFRSLPKDRQKEIKQRMSMVFKEEISHHYPTPKED